MATNPVPRLGLGKLQVHVNPANRLAQGAQNAVPAQQIAQDRAPPSLSVPKISQKSDSVSSSTIKQTKPISSSSAPSQKESRPASLHHSQATQSTQPPPQPPPQPPAKPSSRPAPLKPSTSAASRSYNAFKTGVDPRPSLRGPSSSRTASGDSYSDSMHATTIICLLTNVEGSSLDPASGWAQRGSSVARSATTLCDQHMAAHTKKIRQAKSAIDTKPPTAMKKHILCWHPAIVCAESCSPAARPAQHGTNCPQHRHRGSQPGPGGESVSSE